MSDSSPSTPKTLTGIAALSVRETEILGKAWSCLKTGPPDIDYDKLAGELGMANRRSAANAWGSIKKKMAWNIPAKSTSGKRKKDVASKAVAADDSDDESDQDSPAPKKKKAAAKPKAPRKKATPKAAKTRHTANDSADEEEGYVGQYQGRSATPEPQIKTEPDVEPYNSADDVV